ncbi:uncharacterized protein LOC118647165 [Monomorium pharaonis]|uniref:uncharacterized protein LOC118647165 n=1 Tax=Monomorium pharaonis TaxID=307658 RepID=UPI0017475914|nr:uncharacterized protein LOC118647165 [Monomorium pharaonis]
MEQLSIPEKECSSSSSSSSSSSNSNRSSASTRAIQASESLRKEATWGTRSDVVIGRSAPRLCAVRLLHGVSAEIREIVARFSPARNLSQNNGFTNVNARECEFDRDLRTDIRNTWNTRACRRANRAARPSSMTARECRVRTRIPRWVSCASRRLASPAIRFGISRFAVERKCGVGVCQWSGEYRPVRKRQCADLEHRVSFVPRNQQITVVEVSELASLHTYDEGNNEDCIHRRQNRST